jgi:putative oxidoreductase
MAIVGVPPQLFRTFVWMLRLIIGVAFIYAGWIKASDPIGFADSVHSFEILPNALISPFALALPIYEIAAGALIVAGWPKRIGALALLLLTAVFCVALISALARGLTINCGCFGSASTTNPWIDLARDVLIIAGCVILYRPELLNRLVTNPPRQTARPDGYHVYTSTRDK